MTETRGVSEARQRLEQGRWSRHRHNQAYVAIVTDGGYFESGDTGRWRVEAGDVVFHEAFEAHGDVVSNGRTQVVNIPAPAGLSLPPVFSVADPDGLVRAALRNDPDMWRLLTPSRAKAPLMLDWPDLLARALRETSISVGDWAARSGLAPATVSRGFRRAFGTTAAAYRAEARARDAFRRLIVEDEPLAELAFACGFADQAHMSRAVSALTGRSPGRWRKVKSLQAPETRDG